MRLHTLKPVYWLNGEKRLRACALKTECPNPGFDDSISGPCPNGPVDRVSVFGTAFLSCDLTRAQKLITARASDSALVRPDLKVSALTDGEATS